MTPSSHRTTTSVVVTTPEGVKMMYPHGSAQRPIAQWCCCNMCEAMVALNEMAWKLMKPHLAKTCQSIPPTTVQPLNYEEF